jgi:hypothetical protein
VLVGVTTVHPAEARLSLSDPWRDALRPYAAGGGVTGLAQGSNIVFSNGALDPWSSGGVMVNLSTSVTAVVIARGGHHTDLFFSDPADPPSVVAARRTELELVRGWIGEWRRDQARLGMPPAAAHPWSSSDAGGTRAEAR